MPKYHQNKRLNNPQQFCHPYIEMLVKKNILSPENASLISLNEFNASALSHFFIFRLVYCGSLSVEKALSISLKDLERLAISNINIYRLVEADRMPVEMALEMPIDEIENPIPYLENKPNKTKQQIRKLQLYEIYPNIAPIYVELIVLHEFNPRRIPAENRELALLLDPNTRVYANRIVILEFFANRSEKNARELDLLYNVYARDYANDVVHLEFKPDKSIDDELALEELYLKVCCKIPYENFRMKMIKQNLAEEGIIELDAMPHGCGAELRLGRAVPPALSAVGIFAIDSRRLMASMKTTIDRVIRTELIACYLEINRIPTQLRETESMQNYIQNKIAEFRFDILKFFIRGNAPPYSEYHLRVLVADIRQKIISKGATIKNEHEMIPAPD